MPPIYYMVSPQPYYRLVPVNLYQGPCLATTHIRFLLLSRLARNYHVELTFSYEEREGRPQGYEWATSNCYVSLSHHQAVDFVGRLSNGTGYDYFLVQYSQLENGA